MIWMLTAKVAELPPPQGPFPEPTASQIGDFYVRLGMAVAAWQFVESILINVYAAAVGATHYDALAASFHTPTNFKVRLDMTNEAVLRCGLDADLLSEWEKLYERAVKKSKRRNAVAHAVVIFDPKRASPDAQLFLAPNPQDPGRTTDPAFAQGETITQPELEAMVHIFAALRADLTQFQQRMAIAQARP